MIFIVIIITVGAIWFWLFARRSQGKKILLENISHFKVDDSEYANNKFEKIKVWDIEVGMTTKQIEHQTKVSINDDYVLLYVFDIPLLFKKDNCSVVEPQQQGTLTKIELETDKFKLRLNSLSASTINKIHSTLS
jgi:hypothetical protein